MKVLCCFNFPVGKLHENENKKGGGFFSLNQLECVSVTRCKQISCYSKLRETNIEESIVEQKVIAGNTTLY